jgi:excisionase family DNA binding protein
MSAPVSQRPLLTVSETAERLRVSEKTVYRLAGRNELPSLRVGSAVRVDADELERWLGQQMSSSSAMGGSFEARDGSAMGRSNVADASAERDGTSEREAVEPAQLAEDER